MSRTTRPPRLYRLLLRLLPREFRRRQVGDLEAAAAEALAASRTGGRLAVGRTHAALAADAAGTAIRLHTRAIVAGFAGDLRYAARGLARAPAFSLVALLTLALGIGATTATFAVVHGVLLRPLPYRAADRIVNVWVDFGAGNQSLPAASPGDFLDYRSRIPAFADAAAASGGGQMGLAGILGGGDEPERIVVSPVTANFFALLGVDPALGRHFTIEESQPGGPRVLLLGHEVWQRRYGADPGVVGAPVDLDGLSHTVVGVLPRGFRLHLPAEAFLLQHSDAWVPLQIDLAGPTPRNLTLLTVFARLRPDATLDQAQAQMNVLVADLRREHAVHEAGDMRARLVPLQDDVVKGARPALVALAWAVALVLLIACANVANLLLARATTRTAELHLRAALGASRWRLVRQLLTESLLLAAAGGALGAGLAGAALGLLRVLQPPSLPRVDTLGFDATVLACAAAASLATVVLAGLAPAVQAAGRRLGSQLVERGRSAPAGGRLRDVFVIAQVAMALVLLVASGLLLRSFLALQDVRPGFEPAHALTFHLALPRASYPTGDARRAFVARLERTLRALPGVDAVGLTSQLPLTGSGALVPYAYDEATARQWESATADGRSVWPDYFAAMGTPVLAGRAFEAADAGGPRRIVIDRTLAARAFPGGSAVGERLQIEPGGGPGDFAEVVGVVEHQRLLDLGREARGQIFFLASGPSRFAGVVRTAGAPAALAAAVRAAIRDLDPRLPVSRVEPMTAYVGEALEASRFTVRAMLLFGAVAVTLAAIGLYGVIAYAVSVRAREIGIRMALGESPARVRRRVFGAAFARLAIALALGTAGAAVAAHLIRGLTYGVDPLDPITFGATGLLVAAVGTASCLVPAWRAARVDPLAAVRCE